MDQPRPEANFLDGRWWPIQLALIISMASAFLLFTTLQNGYYDYWFFPKEEAADAYIYPQLRYTIFDSILVLWCLDGLAASGSVIYGVFRRQGLSKFTTQALIIYFALFAAVLGDGLIMLAMRSRGY